MPLTAKAAKEHEKTINQIDTGKPASELWKATFHGGLTIAITDSAPVVSDIQPERYRGVRVHGVVIRRLH